MRNLGGSPATACPGMVKRRCAICCSVSMAPTPKQIRITATNRSIPTRMPTAPRPLKNPNMGLDLQVGDDAHGDDVDDEQHERDHHELREDRNIHHLGVIVGLHE